MSVDDYWFNDEGQPRVSFIVGGAVGGLVFGFLILFLSRPDFCFMFDCPYIVEYGAMDWIGIGRSEMIRWRWLITFSPCIFLVLGTILGTIFMFTCQQYFLLERNNES